ncbi:MAG: flagellar cap protein FliD N-terminal domain-containing protein, partial [Acidimicrobiales bacterium]
MSDFRVDGLVSGLDTTTIIDQLMSIERAPIRRLQQQKARFDAKINAWDDIQARLDGVADAIDALKAGAGFRAVNAAVSEESVAATPTGAGAPGVYEFDVVQTASAHQLMSDGFSDSSSLVGAGRITLRSGFDKLSVTTIDASNLASGSYGLTVVSIDGADATVIFGGEEQVVSSSGAVTLTATDGSTAEITIGGTLEVGSASLSTAVATAATTIGALAAQLQTDGGPATVNLVDRGG